MVDDKERSARMLRLIHIGKDRIDFYTRTTQFFDYYLKDAPPPKWMTGVIPARLKGVEGALDLEARQGLATALRDLGQEKAEITVLRQLIEIHGGSPAARRATERLHELGQK